ncbi:riboflavin biosynthesis protein RibF [Emticicia oligotrophica DSM 17448]|uniref:Riboflavin biosynthesis protein n=1 Tax=Emticicia oligotrophica (strain DSM 17448 / CIP 109782 / MTCC 6937 / GPTSA100-15) TaxID=929562 RepID=A0ABN4ATL6_EMTOG|nr:bifunctional riboflavin kinase/FAD synthetase [Emticicia oligotrophica]AFK05087.1 riboflavin biosynthesis protein RibF [Emticicia oligotrophica DSM 17448]
MKVYYNLADFEPLKKAIVTSGTFDGVHRGHQKILQILRETAEKTKGESVVITFWPHPRIVVSKDSQDLKLLTTIDEKIELLENQGVEHLLMIPFTREFSELSSEEYVKEILLKRIGTQKLVIGYDHRFGRNREGGFDYLKANSDFFHIEIEEIPRQEIDNLTISSTKIRQSLLNGEVKSANDLLGRNYSFTGIVVKGRQLGRTIGFPTANVQVSEYYKLIPSNGVYAVRTFFRNQWHEGMMNIGNRPTVEGIGRTQEVNIFDFDDDIYGETVTVEIIDYIRPEQKFNGLDELKSQILADREKSKVILGS